MCYIYLEKNHKIKKKLRKKMVENKIPQSVELGYPRVVAPLFGGHQFVHVFSLQKTPSGLVRVQEL
jgi:hypothetical protein